jgi:hypothetical protein
MAVTGDVDSAMRRDTAGTAIGNFMEWYDFGVYGYIATTIAQVFYPGNSVSAVHLIATFSTLAAAYVVRPLGGFVLGPLGDRIGRKRVLLITIVLMAVGTTMSGLLPGYSTIGIWAPILLLVARIFQGLSTGGEFVGAMTYLVERAPDHKRGKMVGFLPLGNLVGFVFAGLLVTSLQESLPAHDMLAWGWRIPLLLGAPFGVLALWLRLRIEESPDYEQVIGNADEPTDRGWRQFRRTVADRRDIGNLDGHGGVCCHAVRPDRGQTHHADRLHTAGRGVGSGVSADAFRQRPSVGLPRCAAGGADGVVFRQHNTFRAASTVPDQGAQRSAGDLLQHRVIGRRGSDAVDRSSADVQHRQPDSAGLHADRRGTGGDSDPPVHAGSRR